MSIMVTTVHMQALTSTCHMTNIPISIVPAITQEVKKPTNYQPINLIHPLHCMYWLYVVTYVSYASTPYYGNRITSHSLLLFLQ